MKSKLNHFDYFFFAVAVGVAAMALLVIVVIYAQDIDAVANQILNK